MLTHKCLQNEQAFESGRLDLRSVHIVYNNSLYLARELPLIVIAAHMSGLYHSVMTVPSTDL